MSFLGRIFGKDRSINAQDTSPSIDRETLSEDTPTDINYKVSLPKAELGEIVRELEENSKSKVVAESLRTLIKNNSHNVNNYKEILSSLKVIIDNLKSKTDFVLQLEEITNHLDKIKLASFSNSYTNPLDFHRDFPTLDIEYKVLQWLQENIPNIYSDASLEKLYSQYGKLYEDYSSSLDKSLLLKTEQEKLTKEIEQYSYTLEEYTYKYRISPDWEGKKPLMISLGRKLKDRRSSLVLQEEELALVVESLYGIYPTLLSDLQGYCNYISQIVLDRANLVGDPRAELRHLSRLYTNLEGIILERL